MICSKLTRTQSNNMYLEILKDNDTQAMRDLCQHDLFFLLTVGCNRKDIDQDWLYERCREVESDPNEMLDLWAREHYKSTIITYGLTISDIFKDPNETFGIFSHTRPIAKAFLDQIKREFEMNTFLQDLFPDILYKNPKSEAEKWSLDSGIIVKRDQNPKECTVEAWGLVDGQPTSKHFSKLVYDDIVTRESVTTSEQIKKTTDALALSYNLGAQGGAKRFIGTRYHAKDTYKTIMERGTAKPRIYPAREGGAIDGKAVFLSEESLQKKRKDMGSYVFSCFPQGSPVTMGDWTQKDISEIQVGDSVVGYSFQEGKKTKLTPTKVLAVNKRLARIVEFTLASGKKVRCTPDHKWFTGRRGKDTGGTDTHRTYTKLGFGVHDTKGLIEVIDTEYKDIDPYWAGWLSGFYDGEGSSSGKCIHFHQSCEKHLYICERLETALNHLGFDFGMTEIGHKEKQNSRDYYIRGGRNEIVRFLNQVRPTKKQAIIDGIYSCGTKNFGKYHRDKLVSVKELGEDIVYNIQTETGNYICYGYATKNCQMLQNPLADTAMGFDKKWLKFYERVNSWKGWNLYILVDPANEKKKDNDYTVIFVVGLAPDNNYYLLDGIRDRLNLTERTEKIFHFVRQYNPQKVIYEKYGIQSDDQHIQYVMEQQNFRFQIQTIGGSTPKVDRIRRLVPVFEQSRFWFPKTLTFVDQERKPRDLIKEFIDDEYSEFPVSTHDDMLDCLARIVDPDAIVNFPKLKTEKPKQETGLHYGSDSWMG